MKDYVIHNKGHVDSAFRKGKKVERKVRYVRLFNKKKR